MIEIWLPSDFSIEVNALYNPLRFKIVNTFDGKTSQPIASSIGSWDLPLLAKRRFRTRFGSPFLEAGPAFRVGTGQVSSYGVSGGLGLEARLHWFRISPTFRYSHWAAHPFGSPESFSNQLQFLVAIER
jgi:hypothetical protein